MVSSIKIEQSHDLGIAEARMRVAKLEPMLKDRFGLALAWQGDVAQFKGKGFNGSLTVAEQNVVIDLSLGILARPFAGKIRNALLEHMRNTLA